MKHFLLRRLALLAPTVIGAVTLVFFLIHMVPGDPVEVMLGETASSADKEELRRSLGLDQPVHRRYQAFLAGLMRAELGRSLHEQTEVADLVFARLPATLELALAALLVGAFVSFPLAVSAAVRRGTWRDRGALLFSLLGLSIPNFWVGPLLILLFSIHLGWLPVSGRAGVAHVILPAMTLGLGMAAILTRILRASLLRVRNEDYIKAARAKGVSEQQVWLKHMLRNALLPVITITSLQFGSLLAGAVITETIFSWPGIGRLTIQAIQTRDYPLVQGCVLAISLTYIFVNFLADILYRLADPRITYDT
ncbi:MAG TPA: ABC transporter permease [Candidatus Binatia bacterium]|nr:ABC transporter permease [Candidatus Binatia bacterium]